MRFELERMSRRLGVGGLVHFLGVRPHEEVARWMNVADVLCLTSRNEGMPNVVLEALVSGLPVVATEAGGCRDLLAHESAAVVCPVGDVDELASGIQALLGANADRAALAERHGNRYSWQRQAGVILELLSKS
jgi:glycosyltransferase involved in cell wall biosynthesis